ncbi:MAG: hypothetical protein EXR47_06495 [Dehalococcoidia bacterium]|nr:hypothetical protein [Dehalococcoidia bacterium]
MSEKQVPCKANDEQECAEEKPENLTGLAPLSRAHGRGIHSVLYPSTVCGQPVDAREDYRNQPSNVKRFCGVSGASIIK